MEFLHFVPINKLSSPVLTDPQICNAWVMPGFDLERVASSKSATSRTILTLGGSSGVSGEIIQFSRADHSVRESFEQFS